MSIDPNLQARRTIRSEDGTISSQSIERCRNLIPANSKNPKLTLFTMLSDAGVNSLTDLEIRLETGGYMTAGSDTAAITLTYLV